MVRELEGCGGRVKPDEVWAELHPGLTLLCVQFGSRHRFSEGEGLAVLGGMELAMA